MSNPYVKLRSNADLRYLLDEMPKVSEWMRRDCLGFEPYERLIVGFDISQSYMYHTMAGGACLRREQDHIPNPKRLTNSPRHFIEAISRIEATRPTT